MKSHNNKSQELLQDVQFITKVSKIGDRFYLNIPIELTPSARKLHGKYVQVSVTELEKEDNKK